jgi:hypothetical protein
MANGVGRGRKRGRMWRQQRERKKGKERGKKKKAILVGGKRRQARSG